MKPEDIKLSDWMRILFGEVPESFFIEVLIRTVVIFLLLIISMRFFGKRMAAQISRLEVTALFSLAAAIGVPLQAPDRGILPAVIIALVVVGVGRFVATLAYRNERFETSVDDFASCLVNNGVVDFKTLAGTTVSIERLFSHLRSEGIKQLGEVKRFYLEANGKYSLIKQEEPGYGLSVLPAFDKEFLSEQKESRETVCHNCGKRKADNENKTDCANCGHNRWDKAIC